MGTVASNITQTVSFYNTTGVIEKEHNLYYCPSLTGNTIPASWLSAFNTVCSPSSSYSAITISQWQPEDRVLSIKGRIEDFRNVRHGILNYCIVTQTVTDEEEVSKTYYYAFFITGAKQNGIGAVTLDLEPDHFTNVFYLQNSDDVTYANNLFNNKLKNTYIERQHYDRVELFNDGEESGIRMINFELFGNVEESFKYKRQYKDYRELVNYGDMLTSSEKLLVEQTDSFVGLSETLRNKIARLCTGFLHIVLNNNDILLSYASPNTDQTSFTIRKKPRTLYPNIRPLTVNDLTTIIVPVAVIPDIFIKYKTGIEGQYFNRIRGRIVMAGETKYLLKPLYIRDFFSDEKLKPFILTAYLTKESYLYNELSYDYATGITIDITVRQLDDTYTEAELTENKLAVFPYNTTNENITSITSNELGYTLTNLSSETAGFSFHKANGTTVTLDYKLGIIERQGKSVYELPINDNVINKNLKTEYFDTVLTFNPYEFYTLSYLGRIEVPLNKINYYGDRNIRINQAVIISDVCKYSVLPEYKINGQWIKYYQEGLEVTFANQLTVASSKREEYLVANQTQMRNQYAVNNAELGKGLVSAVTNALPMAVMSGPLAGAVAGSQMISAVATWGINQKETEMNQKAKLGDLGNLPDNLKQTGTDINVDMLINEMGLYLNHYTIDTLSYNSICKYLERYGYLINIYDKINAFGRKGWNYVKLVDFELDTYLSEAQEESIRQIFSNGVTLLHEPSYLHNDSVHNYETILD